MNISSKHLFVKKSLLPKSGKGLFTCVVIHKSDRIVEYKGRRQQWAEVKKEDGHNGYLLRINRSQVINALPFKRALGRIANDAAGIERRPNLRNNAEYLIYGERCYIEATRTIQPGEEIFVGYGREFWKLQRRLRKNMKELY